MPNVISITSDGRDYNVKDYEAREMINSLSNHISEIVEENTYNIWPGMSSYTFTRFNYIYDVDLPAGKYTVSAVIFSEDTVNTKSRIAFMNDSNQVGYALLNRNARDRQVVELSDACNTIIIYSSTTSNASQGIDATWNSIMLEKGDQNRPYVAPLSGVDSIARLMVGYKKPNLIYNKFTPGSIGGAEMTVNDDWSIHIEGTTSSSTGKGIDVTLLRGKYILNGLSGGDSDTYFYRLIRGDSSYHDVKDGEYEFEVTEEIENLILYIRVKSGVQINTDIYPMIRDASIYNGTYAKYGEYAVYKDIQELINYTAFNWSGKKMNALGDSIVKGSNGNFINVIGGILNLSTVRNYGVGGSCIASTQFDEQYPPAVLRYTEMDDDAQIIIVHAGTNDYTAQVPIGATDSEDITTWNGALNVLMNGLRTKYPAELIIFSNILDRIQDNNPERYPIVCQTYRDALEAACLRNHMVFYDGFKELNFDFHRGYNDHVLTNDGLHPNQRGANIMGRSIAGFIKWH